MMTPPDDEHWMRHALREAESAFAADEVPIGAVVVCRDRIVGRGHNLTERLNDVTAHAEMQAITAAATNLGGKYLEECTLYVTVEPCVMCAGALHWAHVGRIVFGAFDEKAGYRRFGPRLLHPKSQVTGGILEPECADLMKAFFRKKRAL
ncbi:MAG: nucleoside deaminase [Flavobacteriales bacterium]|nr:nucleoside deaminase [Flavobacteriales bacterium]